MWNQDNIDPAVYESDPYERFATGYAPASGADWAWLQHTTASLKDKGRAAVVLDTGAASRGSGNQGDNKEKAIRKAFVDNDWVDGVILLPENLFYNTNAAAIIVLVNRAKPKERRGRVVLINASGEFEKGRPKNYLPDAAIAKIAEAFHTARDRAKFVKVAAIEEVATNDYNLSPSRYIDSGDEIEHRSIQTILTELSEIATDVRRLDEELAAAFLTLGFRYPSEAP